MPRAEAFRRVIPRHYAGQRLLPAGFFLFIAGALAACSPAPLPARTPEVVRIQITATPQPAAPTPRPSPTPGPTPTPTPTAQPAEITGDLRSPFLQDPTPEAGAYCGLVDTLDFPLNPPDAGEIRGGQDFGLYRSRYGKNHAGEDWGFRGGSAFGEPVYAIGHGVVTYADGLGWGPDQGVVIVRHYFEDGSTVLSFYGHLDPPSVVLLPGTCVTRGQQVGAIGRPRTSPHLHFEIRTIFPYVPGPGYWEGDPTTAGWLAPSAFINQFRMRQLPGVAWALEDFPVDDLVGLLAPETFVVREGSRLLGLYTPAGGVRWMHQLEGPVFAGIASEKDALVYLLSPAGLLTALRLPAQDEVAPEGGYLVPAWELETGAGRLPELYPAPYGGVIVASREGLASIGPDGVVRWEDEPGRILDWAAHGGIWLASTTGGIAAFDEDGLRWQVDGLVGRAAGVGEGVYVLGRDRLSWLSESGEELAVLALPEALEAGEVLPAPGGGVLALHADLADIRVMLIKEGRIVWERSVAGQVPRGSRLLAAGGEAYLLVREGGSYAEAATILRIDVEGAVLERVFFGSTRRPSPGSLAWDLAGDAQLILRFGEGAVVMLDLPLLGTPSVP